MLLNINAHDIHFGHNIYFPANSPQNKRASFLQQFLVRSEEKRNIVHEIVKILVELPVWCRSLICGW